MPENNVDEYIAKCPEEAQAKLREIRAAIREAAPHATERTDYFQMPGYSYEGYDYNGMFAWFSFKKPNVRLHVRPPVIQEHQHELASYATTKAIASFPADEQLPVALIKKLVRASLEVMKDKAASQQIDDIVKKSDDWRGHRLSQLRSLIKEASPLVVEEVKWKKPSKPEGVPVWSYNGILCVADTLKNAVRLTFPKGAQMKDPKKLFNTRLDSRTVRAIDSHEDEVVNEVALKELILEAVRLNKG